MNMTPSKYCYFFAVVVALAFVMVGTVRPDALAKGISVLAVVDGKPISSVDFEQRRNFLIKTTGIEYNDQNRDQIDNDVLQMLIDDVIKINEGMTFGRGFEATARQRAAELVNASFAQNGEDPKEVMERLGIDPKVAEKKFLADVFWASTVQSQFSKQFSNTRQEAKKELERIKINIKKPHMNLDEIVLLPEPNRNLANTQKLAKQIYDALTRGADFGRIAQQYSAAGSGRNGGKLGWVLSERIHDDIRNILESAPSGAFTKPIEIDGTITITRINGKRVDGGIDPLEASVSMVRLVYPVNRADADAVAKGRKVVNDDLKSVANCDQLVKIHKRYGSGLQADLGQFRLLDFAPAMQQLVSRLAAGERTDIVNFAEGLVVFMVCEKIEPNLVLPSLDDVEETIRNRHFAALSGRLLSRLRKKAIIQYKDRP
jgi:peptidyl-prolyl cis-trans isomerase SurA